MFDHEDRRKLNQLLEEVLTLRKEVKGLEEKMSSSTQGLTDLQNSVNAQTIQSQAVVAGFAALQQQLATAISQEGEVTDAQLEAMAQSLNSAQAAVSAALAPSTAPTPPVTPATPAVVSSGQNAGTPAPAKVPNQ